MRIYADFHLHSFYAYAVSKVMDLEHLAENAKIKGLNLLATGDFSHPKWILELKKKLKPVGDSGLFEYNGVYWILANEFATIYYQDGKSRKVHNLVHVPSFEIVDQINDILTKRFASNLAADGRAMLTGMTAPELVELVMGISKDNFIYPAHAWTPWFGVLGDKSGFNSLEECYQEQMKHIHALETGMSSDPPMNWRISKLDKISLLSSSDAHSPWIWRIGREFNAFDCDLDYWKLHKAIKERTKEFAFTGEVDPNYGRYHFNGHRDCKVCMSPGESKKAGDICPKCGKRMTIGVLSRVEQLADRPEGFVLKNAIPYKHLLPLYELISTIMGINTLYSQKVLEVQNKILKLGTELHVLLEASEEDLLTVTDKKIVEVIMKNREGTLKVAPGYDGEYGYLLLDEKEVQEFKEQQKFERKQKALSEFS